MGTLKTSDGSFWAEQGSNENLDYSLDWSELASAGDPIQTSTWTAQAGVNVTNQAHTDTVSSFWVTGGTPDNWYAITNEVVTQSGRRGVRTIMLFVNVSIPTAMGSQLFPNRFTAVKDLRKDRLMVAAQGALPGVDLSDDYIWSKLKAAEAEVGRLLRIPLVPTQFFPVEPTQDQIDALPSGMPWAVDPGYDFTSDTFTGDRWGLVKLRNKPLVSISSLVFAYPSQGNVFMFPLDWLRTEKKYGTVQIVPSTSAYMLTMNTFVLQALSAGRQIPFALQFTYVAGLTDVSNNWPDIIDLIKKKAVLGIVEDSFIPASGSISADGLSQSTSYQMDQYHEMIDIKLNGPKGSNGGLMAAIHGIRSGVLMG